MLQAAAENEEEAAGGVLFLDVSLSIFVGRRCALMPVSLHDVGGATKVEPEIVLPFLFRVGVEQQFCIPNRDYFHVPPAVDEDPPCLFLS